MGFTNVESTHCPKYFGAPAERQSAAGTSQIMREVIRFLLDCGGQVFVVPWFQWIVSPCVFFLVVSSTTTKKSCKPESGDFFCLN